MYKIIPIKKNILPIQVRKLPYYLAQKKYLFSHLHVVIARTKNFDYKTQLYENQKGLCTHCNFPLFILDLNFTKTAS